MDMTFDYIERLATSSPTPGGGGAAGLMGAIAASLGLMVSHLTEGKRKYIMYQEDIERLIVELSGVKGEFMRLMEADEEAFLPLSQAYKLPKDAEGRDEIMENVLKQACLVPLNIMKTCERLCPLLSELSQKGSRLAISDVAAAAASCQAALKSAALCVCINVASMKSEEGRSMKLEADAIFAECNKACDDIFYGIKDKLESAI